MIVRCHSAAGRGGIRGRYNFSRFSCQIIKLAGIRDPRVILTARVRAACGHSRARRAGYGQARPVVCVLLFLRHLLTTQNRYCPFKRQRTHPCYYGPKVVCVHQLTMSAGRRGGVQPAACFYVVCLHGTGTALSDDNGRTLVTTAPWSGGRETSYKPN